MGKKIITAALPYVNNQPHLGNVIGCVLSADVYSRYTKKKGEESIFICGTDEYGTAIEMAAFSQNKKPIDICNEYRIIHKKIYDWFNIEFDYFGHTTSETHTQNVQVLFKKMYDNQYFTENVIEQYYCTFCEMFLADRYIVGECKYCQFSGAKGDQCDLCGNTYKPTDLINPSCVLCSGKPIIKETKHLFFDFNIFKEDLEVLYSRNSDEWSENARSIFKSWCKQELYPRCMTRDLKNNWGVPVPLDGWDNKVFYVWFDAVIGYFTFVKELVKDDYDIWMKEGELIQFMGKDNVFFHTIVLPSLIFATKERLPLVRKLSATEFLLFENQKFSKSRGHGIFGMDLINDDLGNSCIWRYYLLKIRPERCDSNFSFDHFVSTIDADLNNNIGNFCNRVLKYLKNKCACKIEITEIKDEDLELENQVNLLYKEHLESLSSIRIRESIEKILEISKLGNEYVQAVVNEKKDMKYGFSIAYSVVVLIGQLLEVVIPISSKKLLNMCNVESVTYTEEFKIIKEGTISNDIQPVFSKIDKTTIEKLIQFNKKN